MDRYTEPIPYDADPAYLRRALEGLSTDAGKSPKRLLQSVPVVQDALKRCVGVLICRHYATA
jgi:hypothetical protein